MQDEIKRFPDPYISYILWLKQVETEAALKKIGLSFADRLALFNFYLQDLSPSDALKAFLKSK